MPGFRQSVGLSTVSTRQAQRSAGRALNDDHSHLQNLSHVLLIDLIGVVSGTGVALTHASKQTTVKSARCTKRRCHDETLIHCWYYYIKKGDAIMKRIRIHSQSHFVPTVHVQTPHTLALRVGHFLIGITTQQARHLASILIVQAESISQ